MAEEQEEFGAPRILKRAVNLHDVTDFALNAG
jgi:hypothetical protein